LNEWNAKSRSDGILINLKIFYNLDDETRQ